MEKPTYQFLFLHNIITLEEEKKRDFSKTNYTWWTYRLRQITSSGTTCSSPLQYFHLHGTRKTLFQENPIFRFCTSFPPLTHLQFESHSHLFKGHCAHSTQLTPRMLRLLNRLCAALGRTRFSKNFFCICLPSLAHANSYRAFQEVFSKYQLTWERETTCTYAPAPTHQKKG